MSERSVPAKPSPSRMREINDTIRYSMWSVFEVCDRKWRGIGLISGSGVTVIVSTPGLGQPLLS